MQFTVPSDESCFQDVPAEYSGLHFFNKVLIKNPMVATENDYLYEANASGVGVGDFNNDGLTDIFFCGYKTAHRLYINTGKFVFKDVSDSAGIDGNSTFGTGVSVVDINGDGLLDIYVSHSGNYKDPAKLENELFINLGNENGIPRFKESAREYGLNLPGSQTTQVVFLDYDHDGDLDAFVLNHGLKPYELFQPASFYHQNVNPNISNRLLRNDNGHFTDVTKEAGIEGANLNMGLGVVVSDFNNDGWPDIYCSNDFFEQDFFYINQRDGTFKESGANSFGHFSFFSMGVDAADYNNDGLVDVVSLDMKPLSNYRQKTTVNTDNEDEQSRLTGLGFQLQYSRNMLQLNQGVDMHGVPHFSEISQFSGVWATDWSWSPLFADFDNDGWKDLFISSGYVDDQSLDRRNNFIKTSNNGDRSKSDDPLFISSLKSNSFFFRNGQNNVFNDVTKNWKPENPQMSYGAAYADFDNDGALDLVICNINNPPTLLRNRKAAAGNNYLSIRLQQKGKNPFALGAKVQIKTAKTTQLQELEPVRGYESSQDYTLHFGLGKEPSADVSIFWPDGSVTEKRAVAANWQIVIKKEDEVPLKKAVTPKTFSFTEIPLTNKDSFLSKQFDHPDLKYQFSLPYKVSDFGQVVAQGDVNGDGIPDYYIGGEAGADKVFMMGNASGQFSRLDPGIFEKGDDNSAALLVDLDKDGDLDLLVTSRKGRVKQPQLYYSDTIFVCRVYENTGKGIFRELTNALPAVTKPCKVIAAGDMDNDGDEDLFIGGYSLPLGVGNNTRSYILRNDSKPGSILFTDVTQQVLPNENMGMVSSAEWKDMDGDHFPELLVAGEWMSCRYFRNKKGKLSDISAAAGLKGYEGLWTQILAVDINGDGNIDLVVGNAGLNNQFNASMNHPLRLYMIDFENGRDGQHTPIPLMSMYYEDGKEYPSVFRDELLASAQRLRSVFTDYDSYGKTTMAELITKTGAKIDTQFLCNTLQSGVFINDGKNHFSFTPLPQYAQYSRVNTVTPLHKSGTPVPDLLVGGNFFSYKMQFGRQDALPILLIKNNPREKGLEALTPQITGLFSSGQVSGLFLYTFNKKKRLLVFRKNEAPQLFEYHEQ